MLHNDKELFQQLVLRVHEAMGIKPEIIEKDYYVTLFLKEIVKREPNVIFKGGTSLSKCYRLIDRFSEDIDLGVVTESKPTEGERKHLKASITDAVSSLDFVLTNPEETRSRRSYNKYIIDYPSVFGADYLKENLIVETSVYIRAYPYRRMGASCLIYDYLLENGMSDYAREYELLPFELNVQTAERTLIDKIYALGDYCLSAKITEHSRHIYDIYKLLEIVELTDDLKVLKEQVAAERRQHPACLSAQDGIDIAVLIEEIVAQEIYRHDYETITASLLFESVPYDTAIEGVKRVLKSGILG